MHIAYLYWKSLKAAQRFEEAKFVKKAFLHILRVPRIDVRARFTEIILKKNGGHFSRTNNMFLGDYIEEGTLAHYALIDGDFATCKNVLTIAQDILGYTCCTTSGKWLIDIAQINNCEIPEYDQSSLQIFWEKDGPINPKRRIACDQTREYILVSHCSQTFRSCSLYFFDCNRE